jgi:antitoxin component of MazEF toxin-antitoxin module
MRKKLVRHGNSRALVIDKTLMELLGIGEDTMLTLRVDGKSIVITPVTEEDKDDAGFDKAMRESVEQYSALYKRLAE